MNANQILNAARKATSVGIEFYYDEDANPIQKPCAICRKMANGGIALYTGPISSTSGRGLGEKTRHPLCGKHSKELAKDISDIMLC